MSLVVLYAGTGWLRLIKFDFLFIISLISKDFAFVTLRLPQQSFSNFQKKNGTNTIQLSLAVVRFQESINLNSQKILTFNTCFCSHLHLCTKAQKTPSRKRPVRDMYPKVKVRVEEDEASRYDYEKISLQSLKAFEWVSLQSSSSSDESPRSVVRIPQFGISRSPPPSFLEPKGTNKKASAGEKPKNVRANSAPRPRAVLSSPVNDGIVGSKSQARGGLLSGQKSYNPNQNRHTQCKIFPRSAATEAAFAPPKRSKKEPDEPQNNSRAKGGVGFTDSKHRRKIAPPTNRNKLFDGVT